MRFDLSVAVLGGTTQQRDLMRLCVHDLGLAEVSTSAAAVIVLCDLPPAPERVINLNAQSWTDFVERPLRRTMKDLVEARQALSASGGSIVVVVPDVGVVGAAELVCLTTVSEGVRAMAKSAARQWAADGMTVNMLGLPLSLLAPELEPMTRHMQPPLGPQPTSTDIGKALQLLLQAPSSMAGTIVMLDGGSVMAP